ncbi:MAG: hypothetical protein KC618_01090, partial [Candidatus Omnitrophica bacterium]|nr:hypothetical protein [Candidatus Omnitrophota bacterium]
GIQLPVPGSVVPLSPVYIPPALRGMKVYPENPLNFDFILDTGDSDFDDNRLRQESNKLIKYFLATLTVPADDLWVNLSPYEADRIIPNGFGVTEMGRDLLAQDYILKQLTASLLNPEDELGGRFWEKIYQVAADRYGVKDIPIDTFNKVWIVPDKAVVYQNGNAAFIGESHLKVMLEKDYFAFIQGREFQEEPTKELGNVSAAIIKEIIIPEIEKEVNTGENFAPVRQIYHSMILASWFREKIKDSILNNIYVGQNKVDGIDIEDKAVAEKIYSQYLEAFQKGVYDYIREEYDPQTQNVVARHYFSGGVTLTDEVLEVKEGLPPADQMTAKGRFLVARGSFDPLNKPENTGDSSKGIIGTAMEGYDDGIIDSL